MSETLSLEDGYAALRSGAHRSPDGVTAALVARDVLLVTGGDAQSYLQGQLSQDLDRAGPDRSTWSLLLEPTGKLGWWLRVTRTADGGYLVDVDAGAGPAVAARLTRFKLRADVQVAAQDGWTAWVEDRSNGQVPPATGREAGGLAQLWPGATGWDRLVGPEEGAAGSDPLVPGQIVPAEAYEAVRIEAGVPRAGAEITDDVIPAELGQWLIDASVSFTKGCYTGQELVARIDSRGGNVPRHLRGLVLAGDELPPVGAEVRLEDQLVGTVTSAAFSPGLGAPVALALVARKVEPPAVAELRGPDGAVLAAEVRALPLV